MTNNFDIRKRHKIADARFVSSIPHIEFDRPVHTIIYLIDGLLMIRKSENLFEVKSGEVFVLHANCNDYEIRVKSKSLNAMMIWAYANKKDFTEKSNFNSKSMYVINTQKNVHSYSHIRYNFDKIIYDYSDKNFSKASIQFDTLLTQLESYKSSEHLSLAEKIRKEIVGGGNYPSNAELAKLFFVSVKTIENSFKKKYGCTVQQYATANRIQYAKYWLENFPDMKVHQIANKLGFYDEFHLSKTFKKNTGMSPSEYRKTIAKRKKQQASSFNLQD